MHDLFERLGPLSPFVISIGIGLLIGLERERNPTAKAGLRTFSLVAMVGALLAMLSERTGTPWLLAVGLLLLGGMMVAAYQRSDEDDDPGTTTVAAVAVAYALGALVWHGFEQLAVALAVTTTVLLYFKAELRGASRRLTRKDLVSILQFAVLSLVILPVLPNRDMGPFQALNPYQIWWMVVLISGLSLLGYAALRIAGPQRGALLTGFFGGIASSTAATLTFARASQANPHITPMAALVILIANSVVLLRLGLVVAVVAPSLLAPLSLLFAGGLLAAAVVIAVFWRGLHIRPEAPEMDVKNPTEIGVALTFGGLYAVVLLAAAWLSDLVGHQGLYVVALVSGLTDVDAITLTGLRLFGLGHIDMEQAVAVVLIALLANNLFKTMLASLIGGLALARRIVPGMLTLSAGLATGAWVAAA